MPGMFRVWYGCRFPFCNVEGILTKMSFGGSTVLHDVDKKTVDQNKNGICIWDRIGRAELHMNIRMPVVEAGLPAVRMCIEV